MSKSRPRRFPFGGKRGHEDLDPDPGDGSATDSPVEPSASPVEPSASPVEPAASAVEPASRQASGVETIEATTTKAATEAETAETPAPAPRAGRRRFRDWTPFLLVRAAHPRHALLTALVLAGAAALDGRPGREIGLVGATVLVGQVILGWHNDLVDEQADLAHERTGKPIADGRLEAGTVWFGLCCAVLLVVPLAISNGVAAGLCYLVSLAVGMIGNVVLRRGFFSWLTWALAFALYPAFLSYGGWGGGSHGGPPQPAIVGLAALLGIGVHTLSALWGLVADNADGWTYLPLRLGLRMGATRLLILASLYTAVVAAALLYVAGRIGLRQ